MGASGQCALPGVDASMRILRSIDRNLTETLTVSERQNADPGLGGPQLLSHRQSLQPAPGGGQGSPEHGAPDGHVHPRAVTKGLLPDRGCSQTANNPSNRIPVVAGVVEEARYNEGGQQWGRRSQESNCFTFQTLRH